MAVASRKWSRLALAGACGAAVGTLGPVVLLLVLAVMYDSLFNRRTEQELRFLAWTVGGFGLLPGCLNGLVGAWYRLRGVVKVPVHALPILLPFLAWAADRDNPKVGCTCFAFLVPSAAVWLAGWAGAAVVGRKNTGPGAGL